MAATAAAVVGVAVLALAVALDLLSPPEAVVIALVATVLAALLMIGVGLRGINARMTGALTSGRGEVQSIEERPEEQSRRYAEALREVGILAKDMRGGVGQDRIELLAALAATNGRIEELAGRVAAMEHACRGLEAVVGRLPDQFGKSVAEMLGSLESSSLRLNDRLYSKIEAQIDIREMIKPRAPLPLLGGWAIAADVLHTVVNTLWERRPELVVECGSGSSSIWLGYILERLGGGRLIALEHDERFLKASRDAVRAHDLDRIVEVRHAPLQGWTDSAEERRYSWYAESALGDLKDIGFLLVDGPPGATGPLARYPAAPLLFPRCARDCVIVLDDADRPDERTLSDRWLTEWPELQRGASARGAVHIFRRGQQDVRRRDRE